MKLTVLVPANRIACRAYLKYWLEEYLSEGSDNERSISVTVSCGIVDVSDVHSRGTLESAIGKADIAFLYNFLRVESVGFDNEIKAAKPPLSDARFPMVYVPFPSASTDQRRRVGISQPQFEVSYKYSALLYAIDVGTVAESKTLVRSTRRFNLRDGVLDVLHDRCRWVVCLDQGVDLPSTLDSELIISFSTGKGTAESTTSRYHLGSTWFRISIGVFRGGFQPSSSTGIPPPCKSYLARA